MTSRFASLTKLDSAKIVEDNDSQNTKRSTKVAIELLANYESNYASLICILFTRLEIIYQFHLL